MILLPFVLRWCGLSASLAIVTTIVTGIVPVLNARDWPAYPRFVHGVEISVFCFAQAATLWWLL